MKFNFSPSKKFKEETKTRFLAAFDTRYPTPVRPRASEFVLAIRAFAIVLGIAAVALGGATVYADTRDVSADSPLYPLKRLGESVQLALTVPAVQPQFEASLAARRANEITDLAERHPSSTLLPNLAHDLDSAVTASLGGAENKGRVTEMGNGTPAAQPAANTMISPVVSSTAQSPGPEDNQNRKNNVDNLKKVCGTLRSFLNPSSSVVEGGFLGHTNVLRRFEDRCGSVSTSTNASASTSPFTNPTSSTTTATTSTFRNVPKQRGKFEFNNDVATTTPASPIPSTRRGGDENKLDEN